MTSPLDDLLSMDFLLAATCIATTEAASGFLRRDARVRRVKAALAQGTLSEEEVRGFVEGAMGDFRPGEYFAADLALAGLAVALQGRSSAFAEEYLHELARVKRVELKWASHLARECLQRRYTLEIADYHRPEGVDPWSSPPDVSDVDVSAEARWDFNESPWEPSGKAVF